MNALKTLCEYINGFQNENKCSMNEEIFQKDKFNPRKCNNIKTKTLSIPIF